MKKVKVNFKKHFVCCFLLLAFMFSSKMSVAQEYSSLRAAFVATAAERAYSLNADENVTSALGTMGGTNATLTVTGNGYGVYGGNVARNLTVGGTNTLVVQNVGSLDAEGNVVKSWAEFRNTVFRVNANGTLAFKGKNVISGNEGAANTYLIYNNGGTISSFNADIIGNAYVNSLLYNLGTSDQEATVSDVNGSFKNNTLTSTATTSYGLIFNDAERKSATIGDINATMSGNTVSNTSGTLRGALIYNLAKIDAQIGFRRPQAAGDAAGAHGPGV